MTVLRAVSLALLLFAGSAAAQDAPAPRPDDKPKPGPELTCECKPPRSRSKRKTFELSGKVDLPDGATLSFMAYRVEESFAGGKLVFGSKIASSGRTHVSRKKFNYVSAIDAPGPLLVYVTLQDEYQSKKVLPIVQESAQVRRWTFNFPAWDDNLVKDLGPKLDEIDRLVTDTLRTVEQFERACESKEGWLREAKRLEREGASMKNKLNRSDVESIYPAAYSQLWYTMRNITGTAPYFVWGEDGKFAGGKSYHAKAEKIETYREEEFTYDNLKRYATEASVLAGREFALWAVKDLRRTGGRLSPDLRRQIEKYKEHPGVAPYAERLLIVTEDKDLEELDRVIRQ